MSTRGTSFLLNCFCLLVLAISAGAGELSPAASALPVELRLADLDGKMRSLQEFRGKIVLVNFWASWCMPCVEEMPGIQRLAERMRDRPFAVIGVNVAEAMLRAKTMTGRLGLEFLVVLDEDSEAFKRWGATVLPTTYLLDGEGVVRYVGRGPLEWDSDEIVDLIDALVQGAVSGKP